MIGKLDPDTLDQVLERTGASSGDLLTGAAYGEDAAAIDLGDGETLVVSSDPISLAADRAGTLGVYVACNDVAASGADPEFLTNVVFLPDDDESTLATLTDQLDAAADDLGVTIVGGHTEYVPALERPLLSLTAFGRTDRYIPTGGAQPGEKLLLTKGAAIEGTGILATISRPTHVKPASSKRRSTARPSSSTKSVSSPKRGCCARRRPRCTIRPRVASSPAVSSWRRPPASISSLSASRFRFAPKREKSVRRWASTRCGFSARARCWRRCHRPPSIARSIPSPRPELRRPSSAR